MKLVLFSMALGVAGFGLLVYAAGWLTALAVFLVAWAGNLARIANER